MKRKLPKAIKPAGSALRFNLGEAGTEAPMPQSVTAKPSTPKEEVQAEVEIWPPSPAAANDALPTAPVQNQTDAERRLQMAFRIVDRHRLYAGLGGLVPMAAVNVAGVTAVILRMVKSLSDLYGVPFERDKTRSIVIGLMGGAAPTGLAAAAATTLSVAALPLAGAAGLAVSSVTAAVLTRRIGLSFVERFEADAAAHY